MKKFNLTALPVMLALGLTACQPPRTEKAAPAAQGASAAIMPTVSVNIGMNDTACETNELTVPSGQVVFNIQNDSGRKLEMGIPQRRDGGGRAGKISPRVYSTK